MSNFRNKFITDNINYCSDNLNHLTEWETIFLKSVKDYFFENNTLSQKQYNTLHEITQKLKEKKWLRK